MRRGGPVLLPPEEAPRGTVSTWVPWIAALGLAVLGLVTVPATLERRRLDAVHARLTQEVRAHALRPGARGAEADASGGGGKVVGSRRKGPVG